MLVDNKFLYISLPRRGSTSFHYSCILNNLSVANLDVEWNQQNDLVDFRNLDESKIMESITHGHESIVDLRKKFGHNLPAISVYRDRHESFFSLYKHIIYDTNRTGSHEFSKWVSNINIDDLFFFQSSDLTTMDKRWDIVNKFLLKHGFIKKYVRRESNPTKFSNKEYLLINILVILITPTSIWHNNDKDIIWFDIKEMSKLEKWVSDITGVNFKLKNVNSHSHIETKIKLDDEFKSKYNSIFDYYDLPKNAKTLI